MLFFSVVIDYQIAVLDDVEIKNCFFCNIQNCAVQLNTLIEISIDSCFFEEIVSLDNGGAIYISDAKNTIISKIFGKACATKSLDVNEPRVGQFGYIGVKRSTSGKNIFTESSICSCAPFLEAYDRRSVIEMNYGYINASNLNFSNNNANSQIFLILNDADKESYSKYISLYRNSLSKDIILYTNNEKNFFIEIQTIENQIAGSKRIVTAQKNSIIVLKNCCFVETYDCYFETGYNCFIEIDSCYFKNKILHSGSGITEIGASIQEQPTLSHLLMKDVMKSVMHKGLCRAKAMKKKIPLLSLSLFNLIKF